MNCPTEMIVVPCCWHSSHVTVFLNGMIREVWDIETVHVEVFLDSDLRLMHSARKRTAYIDWKMTWLWLLLQSLSLCCFITHSLIVASCLHLVSSTGQDSRTFELLIIRDITHLLTHKKLIALLVSLLLCQLLLQCCRWVLNALFRQSHNNFFVIVIAQTATAEDSYNSGANIVLNDVALIINCVAHVMFSSCNGNKLNSFFSPTFFILWFLILFCNGDLWLEILHEGWEYKKNSF